MRDKYETRFALFPLKFLQLGPRTKMVIPTQTYFAVTEVNINIVNIKNLAG